MLLYLLIFHLKASIRALPPYTQLMGHSMVTYRLRRRVRFIFPSIYGPNGRTRNADSEIL